MRDDISCGTEKEKDEWTVSCRQQPQVDPTHALLSKISTQLHFLKLLKRSGASINDLLCFYTSVVRPVLEYACPVWHSSLTAGQHETLESLQKRAMQIIFNHDDYTISLIIAGIGNLQTRREHLTEQFFQRNVLNEKSSLHYLLPNKRDVSIVNRLRHAKTFELSQTRTERFKKSFIP